MAALRHPADLTRNFREVGSPEETAATDRRNSIVFLVGASILRPLMVGFPRPPDWGVDLSRLVIIAVLAAALPAVLPMLTAGPAAGPLVEAQRAEFLVAPPPPLGAKRRTAHPYSIDPAVVAPAIDAAPGADPTAGWFDDRDLKLSAAGDDKSDMFVDPTACVYPDAYLRSLAGGRDDCTLLKPGSDESEILTLPFLALSAWILVICAIAAAHHFRRNWRLWRWLRSMRAQGLVPSGTNWRRPPQRRHRRSSRHGRIASRRYAG
jgi:hypothetical protein